MNFNQLALELARERQERLIERARPRAIRRAAPIHPPIDRPPRDRGGRAHRRGATAGAGSVPLIGVEPAPPPEEILRDHRRP